MSNEEKILEALTAFGQTQKAHGELLEHLCKDVSGLKEDVSALKEDVSGLKVKVEELDDRSRRNAIILENEVDRKIQLLFEGHMTILEKMEDLAPKSRVESVEQDTAFLKSSLERLHRDVAQLKKAQ